MSLSLKGNRESIVKGILGAMTDRKFSSASHGEVPSTVKHALDLVSRY